MEFEAFSSSGNFELQPCTTCGRKFNPDTLVKHENICRKTQLKSRQRKVFNSAKQRIADTGASLKNLKTQPGEVQPQPIKDTHWRERHLEFVNAIRSARGAQKAIRTGGPLPPPPPPSQNPNYIGCPHCSRRFNPTAAERHIPFCAQRTKTHGTPIKPLHKRAAADVSYSSTGVRKAYDNQVVRRKSSANPYAYAQPTNDFSNMSVYSAAYGGRGPETSYRQEFRSTQTNAAPKYSGYTSHQPPSPPKTTQVNNQRSTARSALSSGRNRTARPKSSVRFSDKVDVETFQTNGGDTIPSPRPPSHPPPAYPGTNGSAGYHGNQGSYRTTKASEMRLQRAQTAGNVGQGSSPRQQPVEVGGSGRPMNSTFTWRDKNSPSFETMTKLDSPGGMKSGGYTSLQNGNFSPPSPSGSSPREFTRGRSSLSNSPQSYTPPLRGGSHTPSPLTSPIDCTTPTSPGHASISPRHGAKLEAVNGGVPAPFCFQCGTQYPVQEARFCCGCGIRRAFLTPNSLS
ncbi:zinc finger C2HC domain-containing protein 1A-like [Patiria miniata]|uniref:C2HC/C3H-type domain-containing protein n=1 Tax=Patiria miniata TaxID=46514 RepID=A0A914BSB1_PATMI|nr:zinc finger C2HC domain-containing protein 1A-like [Patiria miniata]